jgi:hypothetical protein
VCRPRHPLNRQSLGLYGQSCMPTMVCFVALPKALLEMRGFEQQSRSCEVSHGGGALSWLQSSWECEQTSALLRMCTTQSRRMDRKKTVWWLVMQAAAPRLLAVEEAGWPGSDGAVLWPDDCCLRPVESSRSLERLASFVCPLWRLQRHTLLHPSGRGSLFPDLDV